MIPFTTWRDILVGLAEFKIWEGQIRSVEVKFIRVGNSLTDGSRIRYAVHLKRTSVSQMVETAFDALEQCSGLIREAHGL